MGFHTRAEWTDRPVSLPAAGRNVESAVIHHTVAQWHPGQDKAAWLRGLEHSVTDHVAPGNSQPLLAIDYNEMIFPDGDVWEGRGLSKEDAATYHYNAKSVSWGLIGNYDVNQVPNEVITALAWRIRTAIDDHWLLDHPTIQGHRDVGTFATACPGRYMEARLGQVRALVIAGIPGSMEDMTPDEHGWLQQTVMLATATNTQVAEINAKVDALTKRFSRQGFLGKQIGRIFRNTDPGNTPAP